MIILAHPELLRVVLQQDEGGQPACWEGWGWGGRWTASAGGTWAGTAAGAVPENVRETRQRLIRDAGNVEE
jgi:hypothetical protein